VKKQWTRKSKKEK